MENGQNGKTSARERFPEIFGLIRFLDFEPAGQKRVLETGWTFQNFTRRQMYDGTPGRKLLLRTNSHKIGITIDYDVPRRNGEPRFLMKRAMTEQRAIFHLERYGEAMKRGQDYVIPH